MSIVIDDSAPILVPVGTPVNVPAPTRKGYHTFKRNKNETTEAMQTRVQEKVNMLKVRALPLILSHAVSARANV